MKKFWLGCARIFCRFIAATLWQLIWLVPVALLCWYGKLVVPSWIHARFNIDQTHDRLVSLEHFADMMKQNSSLSNPTALLHYISAQMAKISVSVKLNTLEATSDILQNVCIWILNLLWILAVVYAVVRIVRAYRARSQAYVLAQQVAYQIRPDILSLQNEVAALRAEIQSLKQQGAMSQQTEEQSGS